MSEPCTISYGIEIGQAGVFSEMVEGRGEQREGGGNEGVRRLPALCEGVDFRLVALEKCSPSS